MADIPPEPPEDDASAEAPPAAAPPPALLDRLGPRALRRMTPRLGVAIAGAGALIAVGGATGLGGDQLVSDDGDVQRIPGILLSAIVIAAGFVAVQKVRSGAIASAGATAAALGVPVLLFFLTFSESDFPPFSVDAILLVSALAWIAAFVVGPSAGRVFFLGAALVASWLFVLNLVEPVEQLTPFGMLGAAMEASSGSSEFGSGDSALAAPDFEIDEETGEIIFDEDDFSSSFEDDFSFEPPDFTDVAVISIAFGIAYSAAALLLSRRGYHGAGTPFAAVAAVALAAGVSFWSPELEEIGTGILLLVLGVGLAAAGAATRRRGTAWIGGGAVGLGALLLAGKAVEDVDASGQSFAFLVLGVVVVIAGHAIAVAVDEPDEELEDPSFAAGTRRGPGTGPAPVVEVDLEEG